MAPLNSSSVGIQLSWFGGGISANHGTAPIRCDGRFDKLGLWVSAGDGDSTQLTPVIGFAAMPRAAITEEAIGSGIGVEIESFDLIYASCDQAMNDIGFQVEMRLARRACDEETLVVRVGVGETRTEIFVDLVRRLGDARTDGGMNVLALRAELLHCLDGRIRHSGERAAPTGMRRADHHCMVVREKNRGAVGRENSEEKVGPVGDHCVDPRAFGLLPCLIGDDDLGGMNLVNGREFGLGKKRRDCETAIAGNGLAIVIASETDIEARAFANGDAAPATEEAMRKPAKAYRPDDFNVAHRTFRMMMSSSA